MRGSTTTTNRVLAFAMLLLVLAVTYASTVSSQGSSAGMAVTAGLRAAADDSARKAAAASAAALAPVLARAAMTLAPPVSANSHRAGHLYGLCRSSAAGQSYAYSILERLRGFSCGRKDADDELTLKRRLDDLLAEARALKKLKKGLESRMNILRQEIKIIYALKNKVGALRDSDTKQRVRRLLDRLLARLREQQRLLRSEIDKMRKLFELKLKEFIKAKLEYETDMDRRNRIDVSADVFLELRRCRSLWNASSTDVRRIYDRVALELKRANATIAIKDGKIARRNARLRDLRLKLRLRKLRHDNVVALYKRKFRRADEALRKLELDNKNRMLDFLRVKDDVTKKAKQYYALRKRFRQKRGELRRLKRRLRKLVNRLKRASRGKDDKRIADLKKSVGDMTDAAEKLKVVVEELRLRVKLAWKDLRTLRERLFVGASGMFSMVDVVDRKDAEMRQIRNLFARKIDRLKKKIHTLKTVIKGGSRVSTRLYKKIEMLRGVKRRLLAEMRRLLKKQKGIILNDKRILRRYGLLRSTIRADKLRIGSLESGAKDMRKRLRELKAKMHEVDRESTAVKDENSMLKEAARRLNTQIRLLSDESDSCQNQLNGFARMEVQDALNEEKMDKQNNDADTMLKTARRVVEEDAKEEMKRTDKGEIKVDEAMPEEDTEEEDVLDTEEYDDTLEL